MTPYTPDDARITTAALEFLRSPPGLLLRNALVELPDPAAASVAQIASLRKKFPAEPLHAGLALFAQQARARRKFPNLPFVWATPEALEQATGRRVAEWKAARFARARPARIYDLCCGIGGDALALADAAPTTAVDLSPIRTACLRFNAMDESPPPRFAPEILTADIASMIEQIPPGALIHIDPARRITHSRGKKRSPHYADSIPPPALIEKFFSRVCAGEGGGAIKLSPATDFSELPEGHLELISDKGTVVQAVLWRGVLAEDSRKRTATVLADGQTPFSFTAVPGEVDLGALPAAPFTLYEVDGAVTRAGLAGALAEELEMVPVTGDGGYCVSAGPAISHTALTAFTVRAVTRFSESRVMEVLGELPAVASRALEVKSRGHLPGVDTDHLQRAWSKGAPVGRTVLLFAYEGDTVAAVGERI